MSTHPILLVGGAGMVGRWTARYLRASHPNTPILLGGRDQRKSQEIATEIGNAEAVAIDLYVADLGLGDRPVSAVAVFFTDPSLAVMRFAQHRAVPYIGISTALHAIGPEISTFVHNPSANPVVIGTEWLVGAATVPALHIAKNYSSIDSISIGALIDENDTGGPEQGLDHDRAIASNPPALLRRDGQYSWHAAGGLGEKFRSADGTEIDGFSLSLVDVVALSTETGALDVQLNLGVGISSSRRRGDPMSTEIIIEIAGKDKSHQPMRTRHALIFPGGQLPLTGLGVALVIERLVGLAEIRPPCPGLYFPYQLLDHASYLARLEAEGGRIEQLEHLPHSL